MALRGLIFVAIALVSILAMGAFHYNYVLNVDYPYQVAVESHLWNAYYLPTPEAMISELNLAKDGMRELGLNESMYAFWFTWEKTPNRQMEFQYSRLDEIIERIDAIIDWRDRGLARGNVEQFQDVYQAKIESVREMLVQNGKMTIDDIAEKTYLLNYHIPYYFGLMISPPLFGIFLVGLFFGGTLLSMNNKIYHYEDDIFGWTAATIIGMSLLAIPLMLGLTWINMAG